MFCHVYTGSGTGKLFTVFSISKTCIVSVFLGDGAMIYLFCAAITDIGLLIQSFALFLLKNLASLIKGGAGSEFYIAENDISGYGSDEYKSYGHYRKYLCDTSRIDGEPLLLWKWLLDPCKESGQCS